MNAQTRMQDERMQKESERVRLLEESLAELSKRPIMAFDETGLKELVCATVIDNKRGLLKRGSTQVRELMAKALAAKVEKEMNAHKAPGSSAKQVESAKQGNSGGNHNLAPPGRSKYPEDYDSTSDYEVKKLGEVVK